MAKNVYTQKMAEKLVEPRGVEPLTSTLPVLDGRAKLRFLYLFAPRCSRFAQRAFRLRSDLRYNGTQESRNHECN